MALNPSPDPVSPLRNRPLDVGQSIYPYRAMSSVDTEASHRKRASPPPNRRVSGGERVRQRRKSHHLGLVFILSRTVVGMGNPDLSFSLISFIQRWLHPNEERRTSLNFSFLSIFPSFPFSSGLFSFFLFLSSLLLSFLPSFLSFFFCDAVPNPV